MFSVAENILKIRNSGFQRHLADTGVFGTLVNMALKLRHQRVAQAVYGPPDERE